MIYIYDIYIHFSYQNERLCFVCACARTLWTILPTVGNNSFIGSKYVCNTLHECDTHCYTHFIGTLWSRKLVIITNTKTIIRVYWKHLTHLKKLLEEPDESWSFFPFGLLQSFLLRRMLLLGTNVYNFARHCCYITRNMFISVMIAV